MALSDSIHASKLNQNKLWLSVLIARYTIHKIGTRYHICILHGSLDLEFRRSQWPVIVAHYNGLIWYPDNQLSVKIWNIVLDFQLPTRHSNQSRIFRSHVWRVFKWNKDITQSVNSSVIRWKDCIRTKGYLVFVIDSVYNSRNQTSTTYRNYLCRVIFIDSGNWANKTNELSQLVPNYYYTISLNIYFTTDNYEK